MNDEIRYLKTKTETYPYSFTLNVMSVIQKKYGNMKAWADLIEPTKDENGIQKEPDIEAILLFFTEAINEGIDIENDKKSLNRSFVTERQVGRIISEIGLKEAGNQLKGIAISSTGSDNVELPQKNAISTQNQ